jgi:lysophospholipase L1-like esterase
LRQASFVGQVNKTFWRPFLIVFLAAAILVVAAPYIPEWANPILPLKKLNLLGNLTRQFTQATPDTLTTQQPQRQISSELEPLRPLLGSLEQLREVKGGNVRIAYFGDSIIEGDLISGRLRYLLQNTYGGNGVGLVPITSIVSGFRKTIRHTFSRNWETLSFMNRGGKNSPLGMIGYTFIPRTYYYEETVIQEEPLPFVPDTLGVDTSYIPPPPPQARKERRRYYVDGPAWVEYAGVNTPGGASQFKRIRLFYSHASTGSQVRVSFDGGESRSYPLSAAEGLKVLDLSPVAPVSKIRLVFNPNDPIHLYGASFDDNQGVYVDNLAVRGYSGLHFDALSAENLRGFQGYLNYDLVILQYGENVSRPEVRNYSFYTKGMEETISHIQSAMPGVPILLISAHDRSVKQNGVFRTSPDIPILVKAQSEAAIATNSAFWNLFEAMGGIDSMPTYVSARPQLAGKDYTHFTRAGADKIAAMLYQVVTTGKNH